MRKITAIALSMFAGAAMAQNADEFRLPVEFPLFDRVIFYDGYQSEIIDKDLDDGVFRLKNSLYSVPVSDAVIDRLGADLSLEVRISARCDNYDRMGDFNLALVPKGSASYAYDDVRRIEIARLVTPFMNMNRLPGQVSYSYSIPGVSLILRDPDLRARYDFWLEFELFGVPYAANQQVMGCAGHNDVFTGWASFLTDATPAGADSRNVLVPVYAKQPEERGEINFNNYRAEACDTLGVTTRTFTFEVPEDVADSRMMFIMSNHGAANGGEEYNRRLHLIYLDGELITTYIPGGVSCEPYRRFNTQPNGIYGTGAKPDEYWESFSNWCPGAAIPLREIPLGALRKGTHKFMIRVPDAEFVGQTGDFRPSLYFQGVTEGTVPLNVEAVEWTIPGVTFTDWGGTVAIDSPVELVSVAVYGFDGRLLYGASRRCDEVDMSSYPPGAYIIVVTDADGRTASFKYVRQ